MPASPNGRQGPESIYPQAPKCLEKSEKSGDAKEKGGSGGAAFYPMPCSGRR